MSFSIAIAFSCSSLRAVSRARRCWLVDGLDVHRPEQVDPHHLGDAAGIVAVGLVHLRLEERLGMPGLDADHRQAGLGQSAEQPLRQGTRLKPDPDQPPGGILQKRGQDPPDGWATFISRQIVPVSSTMQIEVSLSETSSPA